MKASAILEKLKSLSEFPVDPTVDSFKEGDSEKEVKKAAVCFIATPAVIKAARDWGADLIITHEPTYHDHFDRFEDNFVEKEKKALLQSTGLPVFRYHDHAHRAPEDLINKGFMETLGLPYTLTEKGKSAVLENAVTPLELAKLIEEKTGTKHVRIVGKRVFDAKRLDLQLGACGDVAHLPFKEGKTDVVIAGETCEWKCLEFIRDAAELGHDCAALILGHVGSERDGMKYICGIVKDMGIDAKYFECGEVYSYTED